MTSDSSEQETLIVRIVSVVLLVISFEALHAQTTAGELLRMAVWRNNLTELDNLLSAGADPNSLDQLGQTTLSSALVNGQPVAVQRLLAAHADPNQVMTPRGQRSETPLQYAAEHGNTGVASMLISSGARVNDTGRTGRAPLHYAVGRLDAMALLVEKGADVNIRDSDGGSPLDDAVWRGSLDATALLLAHGARMNEPHMQTGATPINEAAFRGNAGMIEYLLLFHPDLTIADKRSRLPVENAIRSRKENAALLLLRAQPAGQWSGDLPRRLTELAIQTDEARVLGALLDMPGTGIGINESLPSGYTPLDAAVFGGAIESARLLLDRGADPNRSGKDDATPLEDAAYKGANAIVALLLDHGAGINHINATTRTTPLYTAASSGKLETVKLLLERGADSSLCGPDRRSALQAAAGNGFEQVAAELRGHGAQLQCR